MALAAVPGTSLGQAINIDVGDPTQPVPAVTYGAGSGQTGTWNAFGDPGNVWPLTLPVVDVTGAATSVVVTGTNPGPNRLGNYTSDQPCTTGDDEALLDDLLDVGVQSATSTWTIENLADGDYDVYSYAAAPDSVVFATEVTAAGSADPAQVVAGDFCSAGHALGVTYAKHRVTVAGGAPVTLTFVTDFGFGSVNGIQVVPFVPKADCGDGTTPGNYCVNDDQPFSTGPSTITASALSISILANDLVLSADSLPEQPGIFIASSAPGDVVFFNGHLCVSPAGLQRLKPVQVPDSNGDVVLAVDLATSAQTPTGGCAPVNVSAGSAYFFQRWNRDPDAGGGNANFSDAVAVCFVP